MVLGIFYLIIIILRLNKHYNFIINSYPSLFASYVLSYIIYNFPKIQLQISSLKSRSETNSRSISSKKLIYFLDILKFNINLIYSILIAGITCLSYEFFQSFFKNHMTFDYNDVLFTLFGCVIFFIFNFKKMNYSSN